MLLEQRFDAISVAMEPYLDKMADVDDDCEPRDFRPTPHNSDIQEQISLLRQEMGVLFE